MTQQRRTEHRLDAARQRLVSIIRELAGPDLTEEKARGLLERVNAWNSPQVVYKLDKHLEAHPDAFLAPSPHCPRVFVKLLRLLDAEGFGDKVVLLGCARCGRADRALLRVTPEGRCCESCMAEAGHQSCARCGRVAFIAIRRADGPICRACYNKDPERKVQCAGCGEMRIPKRRLPDGAAQCERCATPTAKPCSYCGKVRRVRARTEKGPACATCYATPPQRRCGRCGEIAPVHARANGDRPDLCRRCYHHSRDAGECVACGRVRNGSRLRGSGPFYCLSCRRKPERCVVCGEDRVVHTRWPVGAVCRKCYDQRIYSPAACTSCGEIRVLVGTGTDGPTCALCCGIELNYACRKCGEERYRQFKDGWCVRCVAHDRLNNLLSGDDGEVLPHLRPLAAALSSANPSSLVTWLRSGRSARLLAQLIDEGAEISHEALDQLPNGSGTSYIRELLVSTDILPRRNEPFAQLTLWAGAAVAVLPPRQQQVIRPFAEWHVIRDARRRVERGRYRQAAGAYDRRQIRAAIEFLSWLDSTATSVGMVNQQHIDDYFCAYPARREPVKLFLQWIKARKIAGGFDIPKRKTGLPIVFHTDDDYERQLRRCLTDSDLPLEVRVAAALIHLYAIPLPRLVELTVEKFDQTSESAHLTIDKYPVLLPPTLARLIERQIEQGVPNTMVRTINGSAYLFPGRPANRPRNPSALRQTLTTHGFPTRMARNTAMIAAIGDMPPKVVADLFGIHPNTAHKWDIYAQSSWSQYLAARDHLTEDQCSPQPNQQ